MTNIKTKKAPSVLGTKQVYAAESLKRLYETNNFRTLIYTGTINQMRSAIWAVDFVAFLGFLVPFAAFFKFRAAITIS
jgi:hypothetical protein